MIRMDVYTRAKLRAVADDEERSTASMIRRLIDLAGRDVQTRKPGLPDALVLVNGEVVSEGRMLKEGGWLFLPH
jgi:hypothetical protein